MARVKQLDVITGSIQNLSFYTRKGSDQVLVRTKGGATRNKIRRNPEFENVRKNNKEFGGCSTMSKQIRLTFHALEHVADYNLSSALCAIAKNIQKADVENPAGERRISLSGYRQILNGFDFNRNNRFDTILRVPLQWNIDRDNQQATVTIPSFACSFGLYMPGNYSLFRLLISLGVASDLQINAQKNGYEAVHPQFSTAFHPQTTSWYSTQATIPDLSLIKDIHGNTTDFGDADTLILSVAIEFGTLDALGNPTPLKHAGAGKILGVK
jgi:hypothetical protein